MAASAASDLLDVAETIVSAPGAAVEYLVSASPPDQRDESLDSVDSIQPPEATPRSKATRQKSNLGFAGEDSSAEKVLPSPDGAELGGGLTWHIAIVPDDQAVKPCRPIPTMRASDFFGALVKTEEASGAVRWVLPAQPGGVNSWGSIEYDLELISLTAKVRSALNPMSYVKRLWDKRVEEANVAQAKGRPVRTTPKYPQNNTSSHGGGGGAPSVRATLLAPAWTLKGWAPDSPGFVFWATTHIPPTPQLRKGAGSEGSASGQALAGAAAAAAAAAAASAGTTAMAKAFPRLAQLPDGSSKKVLFGTNLLRSAAGGSMYDLDAAAPGLDMAAVHMFAHRYASKHESPKDMITYHTFILIEWAAKPTSSPTSGAAAAAAASAPAPLVEGEQRLGNIGFGTIVELAWYQGVGGYAGKANWHVDKDAKPHTALAKAIPSQLKGPWDARKNEIRCYDVPMASASDMEEFLKRYTGSHERFLAPVLVDSAPVRLSNRSQPDLIQYLLNYTGNDPSYHEESRNCQTFAADLFGFLAGKKGVEPYHKVNRLLYKPRHWQFLYTPKT